jgi:hypothetical protein
VCVLVQREEGSAIAFSEREEWNSEGSSGGSTSRTGRERKREDDSWDSGSCAQAINIRRKEEETEESQQERMKESGLLLLIQRLFSSLSLCLSFHFDLACFFGWPCNLRSVCYLFLLFFSSFFPPFQ